MSCTSSCCERGHTPTLQAGEVFWFVFHFFPASARRVSVSLWRLRFCWSCVCVCGVFFWSSTSHKARYFSEFRFPFSCVLSFVSESLTLLQGAFVVRISSCFLCISSSVLSCVRLWLASQPLLRVCSPGCCSVCVRARLWLASRHLLRVCPLPKDCSYDWCGVFLCPSLLCVVGALLVVTFLILFTFFFS